MKKKTRTAPRGPAPDLPPKEQFLADTRRFFDTLTAPLIKARIPRTGGREFAGQYTRMVDTIVGMLFQRAAHRQGLSPDETGMAVIAMGGYGRSELAPYSDVDILVVCAQRTKAVEAVAASFTRLLWDFGFEPGHSLESLVESDAALAEDMDTKTALIESRWVCGSRRVAAELDRKKTRIRRSDREEYLQRKVADAVSRHERYGHSFQLIEPNVKLSPGGMRDFHTLGWLGQVARQQRGLTALQQKGLLLRGERRELEAAYDFLLRVRIEMHLATKSRQDQLTVGIQRKLAKLLGYRDRAGHLAVEYFMREYYTHSRAIYRITDDCLEALGYGENVGVMLRPGRVRRDAGKLNLPLRRSTLEKQPLQVFELQKETGERLDRGLRRRLVDALDEYLKGATILRRMRSAFLDLLRDDRNTAMVVRSLHDTLYLMRIIPEYDRLTCLKRYDLYHHYTVDEHSFKVLENITALGAPGADASDRFVRLYTEIADKRSLFLAALLHDVGKIEGRGHAKKGAAMSKRILARMGVPEAENRFVCDLIAKHLVMSHYSQRRDPSDLDTIAAFCDAVGNRIVLKHLCVLTYADYRATAPEVWSEWKGTLLWELYARAYDFMARREKAPETVYKQHKQDLLDAFAAGAERDRALAHLDLLPGGYLLNMSADMVSEHMAMVDEIDGGQFAVSYRRADHSHAVTFVTHDMPSRLSQLCGVLTINDFNILHAYAFTRRDGNVIDVFHVSDVADNENGEGAESRMQAVRRDLGAVFDGSLELGEATKKHAARWRRHGMPDIPIGVTVRFENDVSDDFTIIDVFAQDRPGLLYHITRALSAEGLTIFRANISTEATRAIDSFYVGDEKGEKVSSAARLRRIRSALEKGIG
jgi:[protein-PII] uridylyltransferase